MAIEQATMAGISAQADQGITVTPVGVAEDETDVSISEGSAVGLTEPHGGMDVDITVGDTTYDHVTLGKDTVVGSSVEAAATLIYSPAGRLVAKAGWKYFLVEGDGGRGVHNPSLILNMCNTSRDALKLAWLNVQVAERQPFRQLGVSSGMTRPWLGSLINAAALS